MDPMNIVSEDILVTTLDQYVAKNKDIISAIIVKLKPAIESIRILLVKDEIINECTNEDIKIILLKRKRKFLHAPSIDFEKRIMKLPRNKPNLLYYLPQNIQEKFYELYNHSYCICCKEAHSAMECLEFKKKHNYPNLSFSIRRRFGFEKSFKFLHDCSDDDLMTILDKFKKADSSMFDVFSNYDLYLES